MLLHGLDLCVFDKLGVVVGGGQIEMAGVTLDGFDISLLRNVVSNMRGSEGMHMRPGNASISVRGGRDARTTAAGTAALLHLTCFCPVLIRALPPVGQRTDGRLLRK